MGTDINEVEVNEDDTLDLKWLEAQKSPYPPLAINIIAGIMATKDAYSQNYLKGTELVNLFQSLGFPDDYTFVEGRGIQTLDFGEGLFTFSIYSKNVLQW